MQTRELGLVVAGYIFICAGLGVMAFGGWLFLGQAPGVIRLESAATASAMSKRDSARLPVADWNAHQTRPASEPKFGPLAVLQAPAPFSSNALSSAGSRYVAARGIGKSKICQTSPHPGRFNGDPTMRDFSRPTGA